MKASPLLVVSRIGLRAGANKRVQQIFDSRQAQIAIGVTSIAYAISFSYAGGSSYVPLWLASTLLTAGVAAVLYRSLSSGTLIWSSFHWIFCGFLAVLLANCGTSTLTQNSIHFAWVFASFGLVVMLTAGLRERDWLLVLQLMTLTGCASALWGIAEFYIAGDRPNGPVVDANVWGAFNNLFFFAVLARFLTTGRWTLAPLLFLFALALFCAQSRAGNAVFLMGIAFVVLVGLRHRDLWRRLILIAAISGAAFAAVNGHRARDSGEAPFDPNITSWTVRFTEWSGVAEIFQEYPVFGSGLGTFKVHYPRFRTMADATTQGNFAHNDYLQLLSEGGITLIVFPLALLFYLLYRLSILTLRILRGDQSCLEHALLIVAMGTALGHACLNFPLYQLQVQLLLGLLFARCLSLDQAVTSRSFNPVSMKLARLGVIVIPVLVISIHSLDTISQDIVFNQNKIPLLHHVQDDSQTYFQTMRWLSVIRSRNPANRFAMAVIYRTAFDAAEDADGKAALAIASALEYQAALTLEPYRDTARNHFAEFLEQNPWLQTVEEITVRPEQLLREGVAIYPVYIESYINLANFLERQGRDEEAYRVLTAGALPWLNLRHGEFYDLRHALSVRIFREAARRGDAATLDRLIGQLSWNVFG